MNLQPLSNCLLIEQEVEKQGLIVLPQSKLTQGVIMAAGTGKRADNGTLIPMELKVGDRVLFGEHSGQKVKHLDKEYLMMRETDVIGVLNG